MVETSPEAGRRIPGQRIFFRLVLAVAGTVLLAVLWVVVTGLVARSRLESARVELHQLRSAVSAGDTARARALAHRIEEQTGDAHQLTLGPAWWLGSHLPGVGTPLHTARTVALQADLIGRRALPGLLDLTSGLVHHPPSGGVIDVTAVRQAAGELSRAERTVSRAHAAIQASAPSWLPLVSGPRHDVLGELDDLGSRVGRAADAARAAVPLLGGDGPRRYVVGFMNEAELRGLGGLPGAYAVVTVDQGRVRFTHFGSDDELIGVASHAAMSAQYNALYAQNNPTGDIRNSDVSPNFPDAARIWAGMWHTKTGQHVDGAVALDPSAVSYLLQATGPAMLPDGTAVTGGNVVEFTQERQYQRYGGTSSADIAARKRFLAGLAEAVANRIVTARAAPGLAGALQRAVRERRLMLWSDVPEEERAVEAVGAAGVLRPGTAPFAAFVLNNAAGSKLDFYLHTAMVYRRSSCAAGATATATLTLHNDIPYYPLPPYVTTVLRGKPAGVAPGFNRVIVAYYATPGAAVQSVRVDGQVQVVASAPEGGLTSVRLLLDLPAHATRTVSVTTVEPAAHGATQIVRQPTVRPIEVTDRSPRCSG